MNEDWDIFFEPDEFGDSGTWESYPAFNGLFESAREVVLQGEQAGVSALMPVWTIPLEKVPVDGSQGDTITLNGTSYSVADIQPDGTGLARIILEGT